MRTTFHATKRRESDWEQKSPDSARFKRVRKALPNMFSFPRPMLARLLETTADNASTYSVSQDHPDLLDAFERNEITISQLNFRVRKRRRNGGEADDVEPPSAEDLAAFDMEDVMERLVRIERKLDELHSGLIG